MGDRDLRWKRFGGRGLPVPPQGLPPSHDALHLHLAVQTDPEKARPAGISERPLPAAYQCQSAIANGTDVATVAGLLGHSQPSTTLDIYTHAFDKNKQAASRVLQEGLEI